MYAIVQIAGKQYKVKENDTIFVPRLNANEGDTVTLDEVLLVGNGDDSIHVGMPTVSGASVQATVRGHVKGDKVSVFKKKRRKGYRVKNGHRQPFTKIAITGLSLQSEQRTQQQEEAPAEEAA